ncbi:MAG: Cyclohexanone monooxygenase [Myxococcaceae bacterium]|nr:Cyclohexanone monooxygenase [Myxococcaceae bacterium]
MPKRIDHVIIVGSGFAGLGMAIRLKQAGFHDFTILEQGSNVGGTWRENHYPGAACDVESHLYSFSFEPNPDWSRTFAPQKEILAYLERCVDKYDLRPHLRTRTGVKRAVYDEAKGTWLVETQSGEKLEARALVTACGGLSRPSMPDIKGLESFQGKMFHSAQWDHSYALDGKRVAVVGTGASAIQIIPAIAARVKKLSVFQRTAPWVIPKADVPIGPGWRALYKRVPALQRAARGFQWTRHEVMALGFVKNTKILEYASRLARKYIDAKVKDPALRAKVIPTIAMGCKRVLLSNDYYPALCKDNVELVTEGIDQVTSRGVRSKDGALRDFDVIVLATGFYAAEQCAPFDVRGRAGVELDRVWQDGAEAYLGATIAGFPNLFMLVGPNTGLGHSSMIYMIESQIAYVVDAVLQMKNRAWKDVEVRADVLSAYNQDLHSKFPGTIWNSGCTSWYRTSTGKNTTLWPGFTFDFRRRTRRFDPESYVIVRDHETDEVTRSREASLRSTTGISA